MKINFGVMDQSFSHRAILIVFLFIIVLIALWVSTNFSYPSFSSSCSNSCVSKTTSQQQHQQHENDDKLISEFLDGSSNFNRPNAHKSCLTYSQRYNECSKIRKLPRQLQRRIFTAAGTSNGDNNNKLKKYAAQEVALLRLHKRSWPLENETRREKLDIWLHVCSFILEVGRDSGITHEDSVRRDVVLYTLEGHEKSVPYEFRPLVRSHSEEMLHQLYKHPIYAGGGYQRGDLAAHLFLRLHHQYNFAWVIEYDLRYVGLSWGEFFSRARKFSRERTMQEAGISPLVYESQSIAKTRSELLQKFKHELVQEKKKEAFLKSSWIASVMFPRDVSSRHYIPVDYSSTSNSDDNDNNDEVKNGEFSDAAGDAHLIWFYPPLLNWGYLKDNCSKDSGQPGCTPQTQLKREPFAQWHFSARRYFVGDWANLFVNNKPWIGAFAPGFGFSRTLAEAVDAEARAFRNHVNQEAALAITAQIYKLKIMPVYGGIITKNNSKKRNGMEKFNSQFYFTWDKKNESAPYYLGWLKGKIEAQNMKNRYTMFGDDAKKENEFDGKDCLSDFLFHPVKL